MGCSLSKQSSEGTVSRSNPSSVPLTYPDNRLSKQPKRPNDLLFIKMALKRYLGTEYSIYVANPNRGLADASRKVSYGVGDGDQIMLTFLNSPHSDPPLIFPTADYQKLNFGAKMPEYYVMFVCKNTHTHTNLYVFKVKTGNQEKLLIPYLPEKLTDNSLIPLMISDDITKVLKDPDRIIAVKNLEADVFPTLFSHSTGKGHVASRYEWYQEGEDDDFTIAKISGDGRNCFWKCSDDLARLTFKRGEAIRGTMTFI